MVRVVRAVEDDDADRTAILPYGQKLSLLLPAKSKAVPVVVDSVCIAGL